MRLDSFHHPATHARDEADALGHVEQHPDARAQAVAARARRRVVPGLVQKLCELHLLEVSAVDLGSKEASLVVLDGRS